MKEFYPAIPDRHPRFDDFIPGGLGAGVVERKNADPTVATVGNRQRAGSSPVPSSELTATKEEQERIKFAGRLGTEPQYQRFENGNSRIRFPVGEHLEDGSTAWRRVYATNKFAERIKAKELKKGTLVEVTGVRQERTETDKDGQEKLVEYIYAFGVKPR